MTARSAKTDNHSLTLKLDLRRQLLAPFSAAHPLRVLDCCAGHGRLWAALRGEFPVASYLAFDLQRRPGALRCDSARWLHDVPLTATVVDIDTYGEPWRHYFALLSAPWPQPDMLIFLTLGRGLGNMGAVSAESLAAAGIPPKWSPLMPRASDVLRDLLNTACLSLCHAHGAQVVQSLRAKPHDAATLYFGLWLRKDLS